MDNLSFTYELLSAGVVEGSVPANYTKTVNPVAAEGTVGNVTEGKGIVTVTSDAETGTSTMVMSDWDGENVDTVSDGGEYDGKPTIEGTFKIKFDTVGQYKYVLYEEEGTATGVIYDKEHYEVTVSVVNADPENPGTGGVVVGWIEVKQITNYTQDPYVVGAKVNFGTGGDGEKYDNATTAVTYPFINELDTEDLVISKSVTGDLADPNQYFLFKIDVSGTDLASAYTITCSNTAAGNPTSITITPGTGEALDTGTAYILLKHGETATIRELPVNATYTVTELVADTDPSKLKSASEAANYNTTITYTSDVTEVVTTGEETVLATTNPTKQLVNTTVADKTISWKIIKTSEVTGSLGNTVTVVNDKPLSPPTGTFLDMLPYIAVVVVAGAGLIMFAVLKRRRAADKE